MQGEINRGRHTDRPDGRHSIHTNQCPPPPSPYFFTVRMPFLPPKQQCQSTEGKVVREKRPLNVCGCVCTAGCVGEQCTTHGAHIVLSYFIFGSGWRHDGRAWELRTRRSCLVIADTADMTVVSAVSATMRHDRFFYLPTKDLAPFSIHIPTKKTRFYTDN